MEKVKIHIDKISYKDKETAQKNFGKIKFYLQSSSPPVDVTITELAEALQEGKTISPAVMSGTTADDFIEQQIFLLDVDNKNTDIPLLQIKEALEICEKNHLLPVFYYYTFSHTKEIPKYRLVFVMDKVIRDRILRDTVMQRLIELFEQADISCRNADRIFLGTNKEAIICDLEARINLDTILKIPPKSIMEKIDKSYTGKSDSELDKLKKDYDFFAYLKKRNGKLKCENDIYAMFEKCEICGHHEDLVYYKETNSFFCFSADGNVGGSIIDYLMAVEHLDLKRAIKKFKKELCIMLKTSKELKIIRMSDIKIKDVKWLWFPYIPAGKLTILQGDPR